jgi:hypothetical protein
MLWYTGRMAKTTTTTKAKTKTTKKKPAVKVAAKTTRTPVKAKRVTKAPTKTTKSTIKAASAPRATAVNSRVAVLQRPQVLLGGLFAALAVAAGFLMNTTSAQVLLGHLTKDELASRAGTVLAPAAHVMYEVEFRWLLVGFLVLSAVLAILRGTRYKAIEDAGVKKKVQPIRWVDYALTGAVAFFIAGLMNGLQDLVALKISAISILVAAYLAWVFERENAVNGKPARSVYTASAVLTVVPVLYLAITMFATGVYGMVRSPWYAYAVALIAALYLLVTARMQWNAFKNKYDFAFVNRNFNRFAVASKLALAVVLIIGLYAK